ncbi:hypothetical protein LTR56_005488 [Elasticomyces elasticus]|nr:hypothetical protein LTR56_005488 [Elasticomyces elasticus]KAK3665387.1 hypothetical protein LTR22_003617 [Elasticomyces elasticus]KAK4929968.1 hypothetical protein LTR49_003595 [Elasticomyces elasticus]KAK5769221.1 hypothetical protein LTS12_000572 [Elasticomyces elasticus]
MAVYIRGWNLVSSKAWATGKREPRTMDGDTSHNLSFFIFCFTYMGTITSCNDPETLAAAAEESFALTAILPQDVLANYREQTVFCLSGLQISRLCALKGRINVRIRQKVKKAVVVTFEER